MEKTKVHFRHIMFYYYRKDKNAVKIRKNMYNI